MESPPWDIMRSSTAIESYPGGLRITVDDGQHKATVDLTPRAWEVFKARGDLVLGLPTPPP
jgi:hypothetical protein